MTSHRDAATGARSGGRRASRCRLTCVRWFSAAPLLGLALVVGSLGMAGPAEAAPSPRSGGAAYGQAAALDGEVRRASVLPFGRLDLAILLLGGGLLTAVAAGAPRLLRPLRRTAPLLVGTATASDALLSRVEQGAPARATV